MVAEGRVTNVVVAEVGVHQCIGNGGGTNEVAVRAVTHVVVVGGDHQCGSRNWVCRCSRSRGYRRGGSRGGGFATLVAEKQQINKSNMLSNKVGHRKL